MAIGPVTVATPASIWQAKRRLTVILLLIWFFVTFSVIFFARELSAFSLFGWPFSFYMAAQGTIIVYVVIVGFYAWRVNRMEDQFSKAAGKGPHGD